MKQTSSHAKGLMITGLGVLILAPDSLVIRLLGLDPWGMIFWRSILMAAGLAIGLLLVHRGETLARCRAVGRQGLLIAAMISVTTICFIQALSLTTVANTLIIIASAPIFAAVTSRIFLAEVVPARTWLAILAVLIGIAILVADSLSLEGQPDMVIGDLIAMLGAITFGATFTVIRRGKAVSMVPASALSALLSALIALAVGAPLAVPSESWPLLLFLGLGILPVATALITLGPRYLPAPEVSLLLLLETVLGPFWVWLVLDEQPSAWALVGGAVVLTTLCLHSLVGLRNARSALAT